MCDIQCLLWLSELRQLQAHWGGGKAVGQKNILVLCCCTSVTLRRTNKKGWKKEKTVRLLKELPRQVKWNGCGNLQNYMFLFKYQVLRSSEISVF